MSKDSLIEGYLILDRTQRILIDIDEKLRIKFFGHMEKIYKMMSAKQKKKLKKTMNKTSN